MGFELKELQSIYLALHEYDSEAKQDKHGRYLPKKSDFWIKQPVVSEYLVENNFRPVYPGGRKMAVCISHDVDRLFEKSWGLKTWVNQQAKAIFRFNGRLFKNNFSNLKRKIHPKNSLNLWLELESKYGIRASYYFLSLTKKEEDFNYDPSEIRSLLKVVSYFEHEVGLHGGHLAFNDAAKIVEEKARLESALTSKVVGYRNHYLKFNIHESWHAMMKAGFLYDTTFGHASECGYRNGMVHPFQFIDKNREIHPFYVLPLQVMDATLENYLNLNYSDSFEMIRKHIDQARNCNGVFTLLWHNNKSEALQVQLFEDVLKYLDKFDPWFATGKELTEYYMEKGYFKEINQILGFER